MPAAQTEVPRKRTPEPLAEAFEPVVEQTLRSSVAKDSRVLAGILQPVVRRAMRGAVRTSAGSLNQRIVNAITLRPIRWRLEAWRTGRPYAEVAGLHSGAYRVEHALLMHHPSGVLLCETQAPSTSNGELTGRMLSAIQDYVQEPLNSRNGRGGGSLVAGERTVWVERGSNVVLALVLRGAAPSALRERMRDSLKEVERNHGAALRRFRGAIEEFENCRPVLESCLAAGEAEPPQSLGMLYSLGIAFLLALAAAGSVGYRSVERWEQGIARLRSEPGVVVVSDSWLRKRVDGLRDPLSQDPARVLSSAGIAAGGEWRPYYSLDPSIIERRVRANLRPPAGVDISVRNGELTLSGSASHFWIATATRQAPLIAGIDRVDASGLGDNECEAARQMLETASVPFVKKAARLRPEAKSQLATLALAATQVVSGSVAAGSPLSIRVIGHADGEATEANRQLALHRAETVMRALMAAGVDGAVMTSDVAFGARPHGAGEAATFQVSRAQ